MSGGRAFAVVAGGGTAGHVLPALAIGRALVERGHPREAVRFVGSRRGVEARLVPEAGFPVTLLPGRGVARTLAWANVGALAGLGVALARAVVLVGRLRPAVVVSVGGYAALPCALAAVAWRVPLVLAESNAVPGAAHRLVARFARAAAVAFPGVALPRAVVTGNPVRPEVAAVERTPQAARAARAALGLPEDRRVVAVFGGSLGSRRVNEAVWGLARAWAGRRDVAVRHAVGERDWPLLSSAAPEPPPAGGLAYFPVPYEHRMETVYAAADLAACRAGATTVAELAAVGLPSVLVPLPHAPGDHQTANARALASAGAAVVVPDAELDAARLGRELDALLGDGARLAAMAAAAKALGRPDAAARVAELVESCALLPDRLGPWSAALSRRLGGRRRAPAHAADAAKTAPPGPSPAEGPRP